MGKHKPSAAKRPVVQFEMGVKTLAGRRINFGDLWEYAPAPESTDHITIQKRYELFIGGKFVAPRSGKYFETVNPATEEVLAEVADGDASDVDAAVRAARRAFNGAWGKMKPSERAKYIFRVARMLQEKAREFAVIETMDGGKPIKESRDVDIPLAAAHFFYHAGWAETVSLYVFPMLLRTEG
jgi:aldehyde dehydrogenase (NAD+)